MKLLDLIVWALALGFLEMASAVLIVALAFSMWLWPERRGERTRHPSGLRKRDRVIGHLRRLFGSRRHPRHPKSPNDQAER